LVVTAGIAYLNDQKRATGKVLTNDRFYSIDFKDIPQLALLGLAPDTFADLTRLQFLLPSNRFPNGTETGRLENDKFVYMGRFSFEITPMLNAYTSYSKGWKGGVVSLSTDIGPGQNRNANPEDVTLNQLKVFRSMISSTTSTN
jgi:hypothetical protein